MQKKSWLNVYRLCPDIVDIKLTKKRRSSESNCRGTYPPFFTWLAFAIEHVSSRSGMGKMRIFWSSSPHIYPHPDPGPTYILIPHLTLENGENCVHSSCNWVWWSNWLWGEWQVGTNAPWCYFQETLKFSMTLLSTSQDCHTDIE